MSAGSSAPASNPLTLVRNTSTAITSGDLISGVVRFDVSSAEKLSLLEITVTLRGKITTVAGHGEGKMVQRTQVLRVPQTLWETGKALETNDSGIAELPWAFQMPSGNLPPSFSIGRPTGRPGGIVMYYVHLKGSRKGRLSSAIRMNSLLLFVPPPILTTPPALQLGWAGRWKSIQRRKNVRRGLFGDSGSVEVQLSLPELDAIPLYHPIPYRLIVTCTSKALPGDVAQFDFPRNPVQGDVDLVLRQECSVTARGKRDKVVNRSLSLGGLGRPKSPTTETSRAEPPVEFDVSETQWEPTDKGGKLGRWKEDVTFTGTFVLKCQPAFAYETTISYSAYLDVKAKLPGLGNNVEVTVGPLRLIAPPPATISRGGPSALPQDGSSNANDAPPAFDSLDLPPSYWDALDLDEADEKD